MVTRVYDFWACGKVEHGREHVVKQRYFSQGNQSTKERKTQREKRPRTDVPFQGIYPLT
jgi:hypothetical protein